MKIWFNKEFCKQYAEEEEKITMVTPKERELEQEMFSYYLPNKSKVHVALGVGSGLDFKVFQNNNIERRIGVDISPSMLEICKERYPDAEVIRDDIRSLKKLRRLIKSEERPKFFTLLTNTLGNFELKDRERIVRNVRSLMGDQDLLIAELYKRPELLVLGSGLLPDTFLKLKVRPLDFKEASFSKATPLFKVFPFNFYLANPENTWMLYSFSQQFHYGEMEFVRKVVGKVGQVAYWPKTGDIVVYKLREHKKRTIHKEKVLDEREDLERCFEPVILSHRWEGKEIASLFIKAGFLGYVLNGESTFITFFIPWYKNKEKFKNFCERYEKIFSKS
ncbi:MAG: class I SAM-dependent methyltransferase [Candidatus Aenigmatarchaeota archaeon]